MKELCRFKVNEVEYVVNSPTHAQIKEGQMVYAKTYANCIRSGLLTNEEVIKQDEQRGGIFTEEEVTRLKQIITLLAESQKKISEAQTGTSAEELKKEQDKLFEEYKVFKSRQESLFNLTAETKARDQMYSHYALVMVLRDGKPVFEGKDFDARLAFLESHSEDKNLVDVYVKSIWYATAFASGIDDMTKVPYPEAPITSPAPTEQAAS